MAVSVCEAELEERACEVGADLARPETISSGTAQLSDSLIYPDADDQLLGLLLLNWEGNNLVLGLSHYLLNIK